MRRMRWVILGLCLLMCMTTEAFAEQQSGLNVRITSNQKHYGQAEIAEVVVAVENPLDQAVYNVEIGSRLPEGFKSAADSYVLYIEEIPAQSTVTRTFYIMKSGVILTVQSDRDRYDRDEIAELTTATAPSIRWIWQAICLTDCSMCGWRTSKPCAFPRLMWMKASRA